VGFGIEECFGGRGEAGDETRLVVCIFLLTSFSYTIVEWDIAGRREDSQMRGILWRGKGDGNELTSSTAMFWWSDILRVWWLHR
jgi:hypothetical protein